MRNSRPPCARHLRRILVLIVGGLSAAACGNRIQTVTCTPGQEIACACVDGRAGSQTCEADGAGYEPCTCNAPPSAAGVGGTSASSASAGGAVASSTAGVGGMAGAAGGADCSNDLSNIGGADFHVSVKITTKQPGLVAIVNQRAMCSRGMFWDIRLANGFVSAETDDGVDYTACSSTAAINDGTPHTVSVTRVAGVLTVAIDGVPSGSANSSSFFGQLPPLLVGNDVCEAVDGTAVFDGILSDPCIASP